MTRSRGRIPSLRRRSHRYVLEDVLNVQSWCEAKDATRVLDTRPGSLSPGAIPARPLGLRPRGEHRRAVERLWNHRFAVTTSFGRMRFETAIHANLTERVDVI